MSVAGLFAGCVPPNLLDDSPLSERIVNDRWVHPEGLFSFRVATFGWGSQAISDSINDEGGTLGVELSWREALALYWGDNARITDEEIIEQIRMRSPGATWIDQATLEVDGSPAQFRAAWIPKPGADKDAESTFGFQGLDSFAAFLRVQRGEVRFLIAMEIFTAQSFTDKHAGLPFDFVQHFRDEIDQHIEAVTGAALAISTDDPALAWFRPIHVKLPDSDEQN